MYVHGIRRLFAFVGFVVESIKFAEDVAEVRVRRDQRYNLWCPNCDSKMRAPIHVYGQSEDLKCVKSRQEPAKRATQT